MPVGHNMSSTISMQGHIVVVAGETNNAAAITTVYSYNPTTNAWTLIGNTPVQSKGGIADALGNQIIFGEGAPSGGYLTATTMWTSNPLTLP